LQTHSFPTRRSSDLSNFYTKIKEVQPRTPLKKLIVTNIKEALPPVLR
jgi:hypothetical protein